MTTVVIDRSRGIVVTDSRGTVEDERSYITWTPFPKKKKETVRHIYDDTQKIFKVGGHIITGSGSLELLKVMVKYFKEDVCYVNDKLYHKCKFDINDTSVFVTKRHGDKVHTIRYNLSPKRISLTNWWKISVTKHIQFDNFSVAGSGYGYAVGALDGNGGDAIAAVNTAKKYDQYSGGENQVGYV